MWTISNEQLQNISRSMREGFERRVFYALSKEKSTEGLIEENIRQNIHQQTDRLIRLKIKDEKLSLQFIRLSFENPALQADTWDESLEEALMQGKDEAGKMEIFTNYLI
jgi:hypothetical protein